MVNLFLAALLDADLRAAGVPLDGVSIGAPTDRSTWEVSYARAPSPAETAAAAGVIAAFDLSTVATRSTAMLADANAAQAVIATMVAYIWRVTHAGANPTAGQLQAELATWKAIYKVLS